MAVVLILIGAAAIVAGVSMMSVPVAVIVAGVMLVAGGVDLGRGDE